MNKTLAIILLGGAGIAFTATSSAATSEAVAAYKVSKENAESEYKIAREKCNSLSGNPKDVCVEEAKAARTHTTSEAKAKYENTAKARSKARAAIADADYDVAKAKCGSHTGNEKDVCIKQAKAAKVAAKADAKADNKVSSARTEARDDKTDANYKGAVEKCDALAGPAKDNCVASAKAQYGK